MYALIQSWYKYTDRIDKGLVYVATIVLTIAVLVYWQFLFGNDYFVFLDVGLDTYSGYYPLIMMGSEIVHHPTLYTFQIGMGDNIFKITPLFDLFYWPLFLLNKYEVLQALIYLAILKHVLGALFFYKLVRMYRFTLQAAIVTSVYFAFCGYMFVWGQHYHFASYVVYATFSLWMFERWLQNNKSIGFVLSLTLLLMFSAYFAYKFTLFLTFYSIFRYTYLNGYNKLPQFLIRITGLYLLAVGLSAIVLFPVISNIITSPRVGANFLSLTHLWELIPHFHEHLLISILRLFSSDFIGVGNLFQGLDIQWYYFESPLLYSGLFTILAGFFIFKQANRKQKQYYIAIIIVVLLFLFNSLFVSSMTGFNKNYEFRFTFFITIVLLLAAGKVISQQGGIKSWHLFIVNVVFLSLIIYSMVAGIEQHGWKVNAVDVLIRIGFIFVFLLCYSAILSSELGKNAAISLILIVLIMTEIVMADKSSLNERKNLNIEHIKNNRGYFDRTKDAIKFIKENDISPFYRVHKLYDSVHFNDSMVQGYRSLEAYMSLNQNSAIKIYESFGIDFSMGFSNFMDWDNSKWILSSISSVKYYLSQVKLNENPYVEFMKLVNGIYIYRNKYYVPMGVQYTKYIKLNDFMKLSAQAKEMTVSIGVVLDDDDIRLAKYNTNFLNDEYGIKNATIIRSEIINAKIINGDIYSGISLYSDIADYMVVMHFDAFKSKEVYVGFDMSTDMSGKGELYWRASSQNFSESRVKRFNVMKGRHTYRIKLSDLDVSSIRLDPIAKIGAVEIDNISIGYVQNNAILNQNMLTDLHEMSSKKVFDITNFNDDNISGAVTVDSDSMVVFQIPYDSSWKIYVDENPVNTVKANIGFIGVYLNKGVHLVRLSYEPLSLYLGTYVSILSFILLLVVRFRNTFVDIWRRRSLVT